MLALLPHSTAQWALLISVASIALSIINFLLAEWRRREHISIRLNPGYLATIPGEEHLYRTHLGYPTKSGPCVRVTVTYQGRHAYTVKNVYLVTDDDKRHFLTLLGGPFELRDGQFLDFIHEHPPGGQVKGVVVVGKDLSQHFAKAS